MKDQLSQQILERVTARAETTIREVISTALTDELGKALTRALTEGEFYRSVSTDLQEGLKSIYREINAATQPGSTSKPSTEHVNTDEIFSEASRQLEEIFQTTEQATESIMVLVEKHLDRCARQRTKFKDLPPSPALEKSQDWATELEEDMMSIMTTLSFQDLTGQRIKRIVSALQQIEKVVFELYMATGLSMKAMESNPELSVEEIRQDSKNRASELKGPQTDSSQSDVDDLLNQLGL